MIKCISSISDLVDKNICCLLFFAFIFLIACNSPGQSTAENIDSYNRYELVKGWPELSDTFKLGNPTGIGIDTNQNIFIFHRADREWPSIAAMPDSYINSKTILMLDGVSGKTLNSWGDGLFIMPHGLTVDMKNNIWVTDVGLHQVFKFTHEGKLLMKVGKAKVPGGDTAHFNRPTDVAIASDGSFYVSDGYGNSRIIKFSPAGQYLFEWGKKGKSDVEFNTPHGICLDEKGNIYVADRENKRIQVFNSSGKFLKQWNNKRVGNVYSIAFDNVRKTFIATDDAASWLGLKHNGSDIIFFNYKGDLLNRFGRSGLYNGPKCLYHDVSVDKEGNIYVGDIIGNRIQKFRKIDQ